MIFHWKLGDREVATAEYKIGLKLHGLKINHRRPDYVTITREEIRKYRREVSTEKYKAYLYRDVQLSLFPGGKIYCE